MKWIFLFIICSLTTSLYGQREADNLVYGICNEGAVCDPPFSIGTLKFNNDGVESINLLPINGSFLRGSTSISDTLGNLMLAFNGKYIYKPDGAIVDTFFYGLYDTMTVAPGHGLFLKLNKTDNEFYLINTYGRFIDNHPVLGSYDPTTFLTKVISNDSEFQLDLKMTPIIADSSSPGNIVACRHANGRDWWVLRSGLYKNKFYLGLLSPTGLEMNTIYTNVANDYQSSVAFNFFSPDGSRFFHYAGFNDRILWEYEFDRCTGTLSDPIEHSLFDLLDPYDVPPMCPSPDGKIIYIRKSNTNTSMTEIIQFRLEDNAHYIASLNTFGPILSPNLRSIFSSRLISDTIPSTWDEVWLDVFTTPDVFGPTTSYVESEYNLQSWGLGGVLPNYANYRLGPIDGSLCDTLGLDNPVSIKELEKEVLDCIVYPNPWVSELQIKLARSSEYTISLTDMLGKLHYSAQFNGGEHQLDLSGQILSEGIYWVEIVDTKRGLRAGKKIVRKPPGG